MIRGISTTQPMQVLYIGGHSRNGSTLLATLLARRSGAMSAGELGQLFAWAARDRACTCGRSMLNCSFWGPVIVCVEAETKMSMRALASACEDAERGSGDPSLWRQAWRATMDELRDLHGVVRIIDSSKTTGGRQRVLLLASMEAVDIRLLVHLQRSLAGVVHSWRTGNAVLPHTQQSGTSTIAAFRAMIGWVRASRAAVRQGTRLPYRQVGYDDLVAEPDETVDELVEAAGWERVQASDEVHAVGANRAVRSGWSDLVRPDEAWRTELSGRWKATARVTQRLSTVGIGRRHVAHALRRNRM
ncbi:MAG: hypothetical protein WBA72_10665 [Ornithinimicrobium sp.]